MIPTDVVVAYRKLKTMKNFTAQKWTLTEVVACGSYSELTRGI